MHFRRLHGTKGYFWTAFLNGFILVIASLLKLQSCLIYGLSELEGGPGPGPSHRCLVGARLWRRQISLILILICKYT